MSTPPIVQIMREADLSIGARVLWWEISQWASGLDGACCRSQVQMAKDLGVHRNTIMRWLDELREKGFLLQEGSRKSISYSPKAPSVQPI